MSIQELTERELREILEEPFENRSAINQNIVEAILRQAMPQITDQRAKLMSMYFEVVPKEEASLKYYCNSSSLVIQRSISGKFQKIQIEAIALTQNENFSTLTLCFSKDSLRRCSSIVNVQDEVKFLKSCQYFSELPRKRLYHVIRNMEKIIYSFGQKVYKEGQQFTPSSACVYVVQTGEFAFSKKLDSQQSVVLYSFGVGYLFGSQQSLIDNQKESKNREYTVSCRSSVGVILKFSEEFFNSFVRKSCESQLNEHISKISDFLVEGLKKAQLNRSRKMTSESLDSIRKSVSLKVSFSTKPNFSATKLLPGGTSSVSLTKRDQSKLPSLIGGSGGKNAFNKLGTLEIETPQYQQMIAILNKKSKYDKLCELVKGKGAPCRGQILLGLMKNCWHDQKVKGKIPVQ